MKSAFFIVGIVPLLFSNSALYGQHTVENSPTRAICRARLALSASANEPVDLKDVPDPSSRIETTSVSGGMCAGRLGVGAKARYFAQHSFTPGAFASPLFTVAPELAKPPSRYPRQWRDGVAGFGRMYGDALAFQTAAQTGRFLTGAAFHEDPCYSLSTNRNPLARAIYAIRFTALDKSDSGHTTFALSNFVGAASAGFVGGAYLPAGYNDRSHALSRMGIAFGGFAAANLASEFSPELRWIGKRLHLPRLIVGTSGIKEDALAEREAGTVWKQM